MCQSLVTHKMSRGCTFKENNIRVFFISPLQSGRLTKLAEIIIRLIIDNISCTINEHL